ncbi:MAG TPA: DNA primase [Bacillota bacterium]|nr:DNA primase [Bacillota bacterium]
MRIVKRIPEETIDNVRSQNDIVDIVSEYVQLKKQGNNYFGLCPFHNEKTPSFSVAEDKQIFHCFGCKKGGNVFTFLMEIEGYSFFESLSHLAEKSGIVLPNIQQTEETQVSPDEKSALAAYEWLTKLYNHILRYSEDGKEALNYLTERGISTETIDQFHIGFSPNIDGFILDFLEKKGFHKQFLIKHGILTLNQQDEAIDRFRGRVIYPIKNHLGKTIAFSARALHGDEPKYLNSSESDLFQKSRLLYNFDLAKRDIRKKQEVILFEGQMDVISAYQSGIENVVATLGSSLTESQAALLKRYVDTVIICYDDDEAGLNASYKAAQLLRKVGCEIKVSHLHDGLDPDSFIKSYGAEAFRDQMIDKSDTFINFYRRFMKKQYEITNESERLEYIRTILKEIAHLNSAMEREHYLQELSTEYHISVDTLLEEMHSFMPEIKQERKELSNVSYDAQPRSYKRKKQLLPRFHNAERKLIAHMLQDKVISDRVQEEISIGFNIDEHKIIATHLYAFYEMNDAANVSQFIEELTDESIKQLVIEIAVNEAHSSISERELEDYITLISRQQNEQTEVESLRMKQKMAEQQNDHLKAAEIAMEILKLQRE